MFERMGKQQQLCFGVYRSALRAGSHPGIADCSVSLMRLNVIEASSAHDSVGGLLNDDEWQLTSLCLLGKCGFDVLRHGVTGRHDGDDGIPQLAVGSRGKERFVVRERKWLQARVLTFECDRQDFHVSFKACVSYAGATYPRIAS